MKELNFILHNILEGIEANKNINLLKERLNNSDENVIHMTYLTINRIVRQLDNEKQIYINSILLGIKQTSNYLIEILKIALYDDTMDINTKYYILYQCTHLKFTNGNLNDDEVESLLRELYNSIFDQFKSIIGADLEFITQAQRNEKLIFVFTPQFLGLNHAPTRRVLDRCVNLLHLGYEVILINTAEALSTVKHIKIYSAMSGNYLPQYSNINSVDYDGYKIPFYQSAQNTPNSLEILSILGIVKEYKPHMIFAFGNYNIVSDMASLMVPVANVPFATSLPVTRATFNIKMGLVEDKDYEILKKFNIPEESLIEDIPTYKLKVQNTNFIKSDLGIPEDKFILAIVGSRLDIEISDEFILKLLETTNNNTHVVIIGDFKRYEKLSNEHEIFKNNTTLLGYQNDVLAVYDCCNLYVNPERSGGGASSAEALSKGLPIVTLKYGDVYYSVGEEFGVDSMDDMVQCINKLANDKKYYEMMVQKALQRSKLLTNTLETLKQLISKIKKNRLFL